MHQIHPHCKGIIEFLTKFWHNKRHCMDCTFCATLHAVVQMGFHAAVDSMGKLLPINTVNTC